MTLTLEEIDEIALRARERLLPIGYSEVLRLCAAARAWAEHARAKQIADQAWFGNVMPGFFDGLTAEQQEKILDGGCDFDHMPAGEAEPYPLRDTTRNTPRVGEAEQCICSEHTLTDPASPDCPIHGWCASPARTEGDLVTPKERADRILFRLRPRWYATSEHDALREEALKMIAEHIENALAASQAEIERLKAAVEALREAPDIKTDRANERTEIWRKHTMNLEGDVAALRAELSDAKARLEPLRAYIAGLDGMLIDIADNGDDPWDVMLQENKALHERCTLYRGVTADLENTIAELRAEIRALKGEVAYLREPCDCEELRAENGQLNDAYKISQGSVRTLRAEVERLTEVCNEYLKDEGEYLALNKSLRADNDRLRRALEKIELWASDADTSDCFFDIQEAARAALSAASSQTEGLRLSGDDK